MQTQRVAQPHTALSAERLIFSTRGPFDGISPPNGPRVGNLGGLTAGEGELDHLLTDDPQPVGHVGAGALAVLAEGHLGGVHRGAQRIPASSATKGPELVLDLSLGPPVHLAPDHDARR